MKKSLVVAIDFSPVSNQVLKTARSLAEALGAKIVLVHANPPTFVTGEQIVDPAVIVQASQEAEKSANKRLAKEEKSLLARGIETEARMLTERAPDSVLRVAEETNADFIIMGSHGHTALYDLLVGSTTTAVLRKASCPVIVVPAER